MLTITIVLIAITLIAFMLPPTAPGLETIR